MRGIIGETAAHGQAFQIDIHLVDPEAQEAQRQWEEQVRRRRLAKAIPAVTAADVQ